MKLLFSALAISLVAVTVANAQETVSPQEELQLSSWMHVLGRHPELGNNKEFAAWTSAHSGTAWYESKQQDGSTKVVLYSQDESSVFGALLAGDLDQEVVKKVGSAKLGYNRVDANDSFQQIPAENSNLIAIRPTVVFSDDGVYAAWEALRVTLPETQVFEIPKDGKPSLRSSSLLDVTPDEILEDEQDGPIAPAADDLASNDLHHRSRFKSETKTAIGSATTVDAKAKGIFNFVRKKMTYDGSISQISCFTWSDLLVRDKNKYRGICDEWAVLQITMLRQAGIPARLKFLIWKDAAGKGVGHACLEFKDGAKWHHMDALWNAYKKPSRYRDSGAKNVTVMDADYPRDNRSSANAWECKDKAGDQKLHPYKDLKIAPAYPGNKRSGYSN